MKAVRSALGDVTVNDIFLAIVSLGLSQYLGEKKVAIPGSLGATVPISTRDIDPGQASRNQLVVCGVDLHADVADPVERIRVIHSSALNSITAAESRGHMRVFGALSSLPGFVFKKASARIEARQHASSVTAFHTGISNVPKGSGNWKLGHLAASASFGAISLEGIIGLGHTVDTLGDVSTININVDPDLFADIDRYRRMSRRCLELNPFCCTKSGINLVTG